MALQSGGPAPYTSATAAVAAIQAYRDRGLGPPGTPITTDVLIRARVPPSIASRTLQALRLLELIDDAGQPAPQFQGFREARGDDEFRTRLQEWLRGVYADVLGYADPSTDSIGAVQEAFRTYEPVGQRKAMAALLVGLWAYSGLPVPAVEAGARPPTQRTVRTTPRTPARRSGTGRSQSERSGNGSGSNTGSVSVAGLPEGLVGFLRAIPTGGQSWTSDRRSEFLKAFGVLIDFYVPIDDNPTAIVNDQGVIS